MWGILRRSHGKGEFTTKAEPRCDAHRQGISETTDITNRIKDDTSISSLEKRCTLERNSVCGPVQCSPSRRGGRCDPADRINKNDRKTCEDF